MTRIEKLTIEQALIEYIELHSNAEKKCRDIGELNAATSELRKCNIAKSVLSYWKDIVDEPCGTVKI